MQEISQSLIMARLFLTYFLSRIQVINITHIFHVIHEIVSSKYYNLIEITCIIGVN